ncbi:probable E3 ubiquitin-protein ligase HERC3 [Oncorhynchus keta]|uniref:probable E3 ubiquitin-protein ligase HERC3 n=1 Tax=Oncorhynchus keta TaxID=8018 RepID=UPI00227C7364|nr:probable E3 ubiquitin-protein ligase HERC3 [Oncorhynchus keta]
MFCWGDGSSGQFGLNFENVSVPIAGNIFSDKVTEIACGEQHTLFLTVDGRILSCGRNSKGQLGRQKKRDSKLPGGQVFSWGLNSHGQLGLGKEVPLQPIPALVRPLTGVPVTQVAAGGTHTLALTLPGLVYSCGANRAGQLGLNRVDEKGRFNICSVPALRVLGVSFISCGEAHSAVLTKVSYYYYGEGHCCSHQGIILLLWRGTFCCSHQGIILLLWRGTLLFSPRYHTITVERDTAVLTKAGQVFTFGEGSRGQLGHNASANELLPKLVEGMDGLASQIACGSHHTLVLGSSGQLWAFGSGVKGQLGTGITEGCLRPTSVLLKRASGGAATVIHNDMKISVGWNSNFIYTTESSEREQPIGRLDKAKLQKWLTMEQGNAEAQREISLMFSTSSSLVASFTKASESPSTKAAGALRVDLEAASQAFDQLFNIPWIRKSAKTNSLFKDLNKYQQSIKYQSIF